MPISNLSNGLRTGVCTSTNRPTTPYEGQVIYETDTDLSYVYNGSSWQQITGGTAVGNSGLVYVTSATIGTTVSSVTVSSAFSATYDNYRILVNSTGSASLSIQIKLGSSVTGYYGFLVYGDSASNTVNGVGRNNIGQFDYIGGCGGASQAATASVDVINPFVASYTRFMNGVYQDTTNYGTMQGEHRVATSYSSFIITPASGTLTGGTITVYGYRKA